MLILTRKSNETIYIYPNYQKISPNTTIGELFGENGHISITIDHASHNKVKLSIEAMEELSIIRSEIEDKFSK